MAENRKQKNIKLKTIGDNPNFTPKELKKRLLKNVWNNGYQIDNIGWLGMTAVYNHFEKVMKTLERNLRNGTGEKIGNETTKKKQFIKQTYIIRKHKETNTNQTNKI